MTLPINPVHVARAWWKQRNLPQSDRPAIMDELERWGVDFHRDTMNRPDEKGHIGSS